MFSERDNLSERERLEVDIEGFLKIFNKEYDRKNKMIEATARSVLMQYTFDLVKKVDNLDKKGNRWFKFKSKRKLQDVGVLLANAEKWEMF